MWSLPKHNVSIVRIWRFFSKFEFGGSFQSTCEFFTEMKALCKELGLLKVGEDTASSFFFDIGVRWSDLSQKDERHCKFLIENIHKLPLGVPRGTKAFPLKSLEGIVVDFYESVKKNKESTLAYKGGNLERALLKRLRIPSVNLESFGCPKAEALFDALVWLETCGNHTELNAYHHCAKVEVEAFGHWLANQVYWRIPYRFSRPHL